MYTKGVVQYLVTLQRKEFYFKTWNFHKRTPTTLHTSHNIGARYTKLFIDKALLLRQARNAKNSKLTMQIALFHTPLVDM